MGIIDKLKKLLKKELTINETSISKFNTDLLFIPKFEELSKDNQDKVLEYLKEVNIKDLESIFNYAKNLNEEANFNSEFLLRIYYKMTENNNLKNQNILYDECNTIIEINELNLCKNELFKLHEELILKIIALKKLYEKETSRKLIFIGFLEKMERIRRIDKINSLENAIQRLEISLQVIEQLIQVVNISIDVDIVKTNYQNAFVKLSDNENLDMIINDLSSETRDLLKCFLPYYEAKVTFNKDNTNECLMNLAIARRLLALYAYQHKNEAINIINDIENLSNNFNYQSNNDDNIMEEIKYIENKYRIFSAYLEANEEVNDALKKLYKIKFEMLVTNNYSFKNINNKKELAYYEEFSYSILENALKGNNIIFFQDNEFLPKISDKMQNILSKRIAELIKYNHRDFSSDGILGDNQLLKLIMSLSSDYQLSFHKRKQLIEHYKIREMTPKIIGRHPTIVPYVDEVEYVDKKEYLSSLTTITALFNLFKIFIDYEDYSNGRELTYYIPLMIYLDTIEKSLINTLYLDILQNSKVHFILPGVRMFALYPAPYETQTMMEISNLSILDVLSLNNSDIYLLLKKYNLVNAIIKGNNKNRKKYRLEKKYKL
ncbi:MAG: hypothetical protein IJO57_04600 [Bacilli bacterium]|nr:hypothetical protein [Bacilli bacterium]